MGLIIESMLAIGTTMDGTLGNMSLNQTNVTQYPPYENYCESWICLSLVKKEKNWHINTEIVFTSCLVAFGVIG